jgi:hypothetical protein
MAKERTRLKFVRRNEKDLIAAATDALASDFPNPERIGCPEAGILDAVAGRRLTFSEVNDVVDHIATCSPCFDAYTVYRKKYCSRNKRKHSITGVAVLSVVIAIWFFGNRLLAPPKHTSTQVSELAPATAVLDFRDQTPERSDQARAPASTELQHLRRSLLNLQMLLPLGTEDGQYSLEFRNGAGGIIAQTTGTAKWDGNSETLSARIDLRTIETGKYTLAVRKGASSWRRYSVFVD